MNTKKINLPEVNLRPGPIRHPELPAELIERIAVFKKILADVDTTTLEMTVDNFKRDQHPENEVEVWECIAKMYQLFLTHNRTDDLATKSEVFRVLLGASMGTEDFGESVCHLTPAQVKHLIFNLNLIT
jgi:hypothetical protein